MAEIQRRAVDRPRVAVLLVKADAEAAPFLAQIALALRVHDVGQFFTALVDLRQLFGDQVLVLHGVQRQIEAGECTDFAGPQPGGVDHVFGVDRALLGHHVPAAIRTRGGGQHRAAQLNLRPRHARSLGVGVGGARRVEVAVQRVVQGRQHTVGVCNGRELFDLIRADDLGFQAHVAVLGALGLEEIQPVGCAGQCHPADVVQAAAHAGDLLQLLVEPDRVALQRRHIGIGVEGMEPASCVPGRARGQLIPFDQHDVGPAHLRQMIEHRTTDDTAADDNNFRRGFHEEISRTPDQKSPSFKAFLRCASSPERRARVYRRSGQQKAPAEGPPGLLFGSQSREAY